MYFCNLWDFLLKNKMIRNKGITNSILELVGETPLIKLHKITKDLPGNYYAKFEAFNPGNSAKDRIALHIIKDAEKKGILKKGANLTSLLSRIFFWLLNQRTHI